MSKFKLFKAMKTGNIEAPIIRGRETVAIKFNVNNRLQDST